MEGIAPAVVAAHHTEAPGFVELGDHARSSEPGHRRARGSSRSPWPQWTIFDRGSSMMSVAPRSLSAGIRTFTSDLGTTVSTA